MKMLAERGVEIFFTQVFGLGTLQIAALSSSQVAALGTDSFASLRTHQIAALGQHLHVGALIGQGFKVGDLNPVDALHHQHFGAEIGRASCRERV